MRMAELQGWPKMNLFYRMTIGMMDCRFKTIPNFSSGQQRLSFGDVVGGIKIIILV